MKKILVLLALLATLVLTACEGTSVEEALVEAGQAGGGLVGGFKAGYEEHKTPENPPTAPGSGSEKRYTLAWAIDWPDGQGRAAAADQVRAQTEADAQYWSALGAMKAEEVGSEEMRDEFATYQESFFGEELSRMQAETARLSGLYAAEVGLAAAEVAAADAEAAVSQSGATIATSNADLIVALDKAEKLTAGQKAALKLKETRIELEAKQAEIFRHQAITYGSVAILVGLLACTAVFLRNKWIAGEVVMAQKSPWTTVATRAMLGMGTPPTILHNALPGVSQVLSLTPGASTEASPEVIHEHLEGQISAGGLFALGILEEARSRRQEAAGKALEKARIKAGKDIIDA